MNRKTFRDYTGALQDNLVCGDATKHTHRPSFKTLLENRTLAWWRPTNLAGSSVVRQT